MSVGSILINSLSNLMKHSREYFKKADELTRTNFENSMRTMGDNLKFFIQEFKDSFSKNDDKIVEENNVNLKTPELKSKEIVNRRIKDGRAVKTQVFEK